MRGRVVGEVAMFSACAVIVLLAVLAVPVMIGFVVGHVHHMVSP